MALLAVYCPNVVVADDRSADVSENCITGLMVPSPEKLMLGVTDLTLPKTITSVSYNNGFPAPLFVVYVTHLVHSSQLKLLAGVVLVHVRSPLCVIVLLTVSNVPLCVADSIYSH